MNRLAELEASMKVLKLQNETNTILDCSELLLLSKFMEYKDTHPKITQREICKVLNISESKLLNAKKRYSITKTRKKNNKSNTDISKTKKTRNKKIEGGNIDNQTING